MSTFDSTKISLEDLLKGVCAGKIQLPDFQRGWVWDDDHIRGLLVSIAQSFPIGAVMLLEIGGDVKFQARLVEGVESILGKGVAPGKLILDGQQRLTTLTQALMLPDTPVQTRTSKGKSIQRHYYFDINLALSAPDLASAVIATDETHKVRGSFGRDITRDLSSRELECKHLCFPCDQVMDSDEWEEVLDSVNPDNSRQFKDFRKKILKSFRKYDLPVIELKKETSKEAVCVVFEKVNTGGVPLTVFDLITASYAAEGYNLRDDWLGSEQRGVESRRKRLAKEPLLAGVEAAEFLQAITLAHTLQRKEADMASEAGKAARPVSAKRADMLNLHLDDWKQWADKVEQGFKLAAKFLRSQSFYSRRELPYSTQIVPLAATLANLEEQWREQKIHEKLSRWFWCGVLGELYGSSVETRIANDHEGLTRWINGGTEIPRTVSEAYFLPDRFDTLRTRQSAAYKAINVLALREGAQDWLWTGGIQDLDADEVALDIHHIFPKDWCIKHGIPRESYDSILNKTPLSYKANRKIGGAAPSVYLPRIQEERGIADEEMNEILASHALNPNLLRADDYHAFIADRRERLSNLVAKAMGKPVSTTPEGGEYVEDGE